MDNEDGNRLAELRARLHNSKTQRNDLGCKEEVDDTGLHIERVLLERGHRVRGALVLLLLDDGVDDAGAM